MTAAADIARALKGKRSGPGWVAKCPAHDDSNPSLSIRDGDDGRLLFKCFAGCTFVDIISVPLVRDLLGDGRDHEPARRRHAPPKATSPLASDTFWQPIWRETVDLLNSPAESYLLARLGKLPGDLDDLRFHPRCPRGRDRLPAMVSLMRDASSNEPTGVHRTYLGRRPDGTWGKANVVPVKMMLGRSAGSVVKLTADEEVTVGLGLSEGIEDGLAIINSGWRPLWACLSAGSMSALPLLNGIEALTVFCDADSPGRKAASAAYERWHEAGKEAAIAEPPPGIKDFGELTHD